MPEEQAKPTINWGARLMMMLLLFVAFELVLLAAVVKGVWFILLVPGVVCLHRAFAMWYELRRNLERHPDH